MNRLFDKFAAKASEQVARAWFFTFCVLLVLLWAPTLLFLEINTSQLIINTATTIITFLLVALLQNEQNRDAMAMNAKLDALIKHSEATNALLQIENQPREAIEQVRDTEGQRPPTPEKRERKSKKR